MNSVLFESFKKMEQAVDTPLCEVVMDNSSSVAPLASMICGNCGGDCSCNDCGYE